MSTDKLRQILEEILKHHMTLNNERGRDPKRSKTINLTQAALEELEKIEEDIMHRTRIED